MMLRTGTRLAALVCAFGLAGCGGGDGEETAPRAATIDPAVAAELAARADEIAATYAAGNVCGAARLADDLNRETAEAIGRGAVPVALRTELEAVVDELVNGINCRETTTADEDEEDDEEEKKKDEEKGNGKEKGKDKDEEDSIETVVTEGAE